VEAEVVNNGSLRPGSFARVGIVTDESGRAHALPNNTIITFAGIEKVVVVKDGKALEKPITSGRRTSDWTEILSGVERADAVILNPGTLQSGQPVAVLE
jgi:multidrug efflux pump subunit AcrA (membrane-fusion protein)